MARVNVETRALAETRFFNLVQSLDCTRAEAIGFLVLFWHDSQERGVWRGTKEELMRFIPYKSEDREFMFNSLVTHEYVSEVEPGQFVIHGNRKHIDALNDKREAGKLGGQRKAENNKNSSDNLASATGALAPAKSALPNSIQYNSIQSSSLQSIKTKPSKRSASEFDLEAVYRRYPRKQGKSAGIKKLAREIKTPEDYAALADAMDRYLRHIRKEGTDPKFYPHFSTWASSWRDWLDPDAGKVIVKSSQPPVITPPRDDLPAHELPPDDILKSHGALFKKFGIGKESA